jgi:hypothetical protein
MADLRCDFCTENLAAFIVGNAQTGEQTFACPADFARLGLTVAKLTLPQSELDALCSPTAPPEAPAPPTVDGATGESEPARKSKPRRGPKPASTPTLAAAPAAAED